MIEKWAWIPGYEKKYEVSNTGKVKHRNRLLKVIHEGNYMFVYLTKDGKSKQIHLLDILNSCFSEHCYSTDSNLLDLSERWKDIPGYEDCYQISDFGRVRSKSRTRGGKGDTVCKVRERIRQPSNDQDGYLILCLYDSNRVETKAIHRLVASAFVDNPNHLPQVNHKDGDKHNNNATNLEWVTGTSNIRHSIELGLRDPHQYSIPLYCVQTGETFFMCTRVMRYS